MGFAVGRERITAKSEGAAKLILLSLIAERSNTKQLLCGTHFASCHF